MDVEIWAHEHSYERLWPIYKYQVMNGSYEEPYTNPRAPVHVSILQLSYVEALCVHEAWAKSHEALTKAYEAWA